MPAAQFRAGAPSRSPSAARGGHRARSRPAEAGRSRSSTAAAQAAARPRCPGAAAQHAADTRMAPRSSPICRTRPTPRSARRRGCASRGRCARRGGGRLRGTVDVERCLPRQRRRYDRAKVGEPEEALAAKRDRGGEANPKPRWPSRWRPLARPGRSQQLGGCRRGRRSRGCRGRVRGARVPAALSPPPPPGDAMTRWAGRGPESTTARRTPGQAGRGWLTESPRAPANSGS